jgi:hypothetical protein
MYSLTKSLTDRQSASIELSSFAISLGVAHTLFKFGSFSVELVCFLALWWSLSALLHLAKPRKKDTV